MGVASTNLVTEEYVGYPGFGIKTSSPGFKKAKDICIIPSFEPIRGNTSFTGFDCTSKNFK